MSLTRRICWWNVLISSKLVRDVMEYTHKKPSPVRMYCSRMALLDRVGASTTPVARTGLAWHLGGGRQASTHLYSSWPAVSSTSSSATWSSITHCFRYESTAATADDMARPRRRAAGFSTRVPRRRASASQRTPETRERASSCRPPPVHTRKMRIARAQDAYLRWSGRTRRQSVTE